jgi:Kdo2-lipid IVA lauroyltransferase/acyltransferase
MFFIKLFSKLPFFVLYGISDFAYFLIYRMIGYRKKVVFENLYNSFPEKSEVEIKKIAKQFYHHIADIFVEFLKGYSITEEEMMKRAKILNPEILHNYINKGQSVIFISGHIGNWEWIVHALYLTGVKVDVVYQKLSSPFFNKLTYFIRSRFGTAPLIEKDDTIRLTIERKDIVRALGLASDQSPNYWKSAYWTDFLHQDSGFFTGTERIARKFDYPVIFVDMWKVKRGFYEVEFIEIAKPDYKDLPSGEITERFVRILEKSIQKHPSEYLWSHRRWKHKRSTISSTSFS